MCRKSTVKKGVTNMDRKVKISSETAAALIMACLAIYEALDIGALTQEIADELQYIRPELEEFTNMVK